MNNGISFSARPSDTLPKGNFGGMPSEVIAMARQMGLKAEDMKQVNSMWKNMDDLAESDPESYKKFTSDIIAEGPPEKGGKAKTFIPDPSFVVKLKTKADAGVGMKVSTLNGPTKFFLNMTSCEALEPPKDHNGRPVEKNERRGADGLEIPLLVGEVRNCEDHSGDTCLVVDAVFNPWVVENAEANNTFKAQVIDLAVQWVEQETKYKFEKQWKTIKSKYKGGLGDENVIPMPFPIDRAINQNDPIDERTSQKTTSQENEETKQGDRSGIPNISLSTPSPESLLRATMNPVDSKTPSSIMMPGDIRPPNDSSSLDNQSIRKPLIEEVVPKTKAKKAVKAVKKGFLHEKEGKPAPRLYDEKGSSGDGSKEGSYSRLMSKCQVVDMSTMTPEQQKIAMNQHAGNQSQTPPPPVPPAVKESVPNKESREAEAVKMEEALSGFGNLGKGFLEGKELGGKPSKAEFRPSADALFDRMISGIDPDYASASQPITDGSDEGMSALSDIARVLAGQPGAEASGLPPKMLAPMRGLDIEAPRQASVPQHTIEFTSSPNSTLQVACILVSVEPSHASKVDLEVSTSELRLRVPNKSLLSVPLPFRIDESKTKAKYSKAKSALKITLTQSPELP